MSQNFISTDWLLSIEDWISEENLAQFVDFPPIRALLCGKGLLTIALSEVYQKPVLVECLRQSEWVNDRQEVGLRRDVVLKTDYTSCVAASTLMPYGVLKNFPWLADLGDRPLGLVLEERAEHRRGPYEYKRIDAGPGFHPQIGASRVSWARRYRFFLEGGELLVTELFSPGVFDRLKTATEAHG